MKYLVFLLGYFSRLHPVFVSVFVILSSVNNNVVIFCRAWCELFL